MKPRTIITIALSVAACLEANAGIKVPPETLKVITTILTGAAAAAAGGETTASYEVVKQKDALLDSLKAQGMTYEDPAIYSLSFSLNFDASAVYWADVFNRPDLFALIQIEGMGECIVPGISYEYSGQPLQETLLHREIPAGRKVLIHFMDDDTPNNSVWNSILQTRVDFKIDTTVTERPTATKLKAVRSTTTGSIQLLDSPLVLDAPDYIATVEFVVPNSPHWSVKGRIFDAKAREVGSTEFRQLWRPAKPAVLKVQIEKDRTRAKASMVWWAGLTIVLGAVFVKSLFGNWRKTDPPETGSSAP
jgi:hypothetical protein